MNATPSILVFKFILSTLVHLFNIRKNTFLIILILTTTTEYNNNNNRTRNWVYMSVANLNISNTENAIKTLNHLSARSVIF